MSILVTEQPTTIKVFESFYLINGTGFFSFIKKAIKKSYQDTKGTMNQESLVISALGAE